MAPTWLYSGWLVIIIINFVSQNYDFVNFIKVKMGFIKFIRVKSGNLKKLLHLRKAVIKVRKAVIKVRKVAKAVTKVTKGANWRLFFFNRMCCGATTTQTNKTNKTYI